MASFDLQEGLPSGTFQLRLLGPFSLTGPDGKLIDVSSKKNRLLIAMLATKLGRSMSRDALAGVLSPEHSEEQARNSLRQALAVKGQRTQSGSPRSFPADQMIASAEAPSIDAVIVAAPLVETIIPRVPIEW